MTTKDALFKLLRIAIGNEDDLSLPGDISLLEVLDLSEKLGINGLAVSGFQKLVDNGFDLISATKENKQRRMTWIGLSMMMEHKTKLQWEAIQKLVGIFRENEITTVGLKGVTIGQWYPNPLQRESCDFDCFLLKKKKNGDFEYAYEDGNRAMEAIGIDVDRRIYVHSVFDFKGLTVENHHYLAAVKLSKRHKEMDNVLRTLLVSEPLQPVMDSQLMMGSPMFNAVFLTHHAHRHMLNEYMPIKLLTDWALFIKNNPTLDWQRYWGYVEEFGMLRFAQSMTRLACRLLGAVVPLNLPPDDEADGLLEAGLWDVPEAPDGHRSRFVQHLSIVERLLHARKRYRVFYDTSSLGMIWAYVRGYLFGGE